MDRISVSHLFIALPEIALDESLIQTLLANGVIGDDTLEYIARIRRSKALLDRFRGMKGESVVGRLISISPEFVTRSNIDLLGKFGYLSKQEVGALRTFLGVYERSNPGKRPKNFTQALRRFRYAFGRNFAQDVLALLVATNRMEKREADLIRAQMLTAELVGESLQTIVRAKSLYEALALLGSKGIDAKVLRIMRLSRIIDRRTQEALLSALNYGKATWTVFDGAKRADGLAARMAYVLSGSFSFEMVRFLEKMGLINASQKRLLTVAVSLSQRYNRQLMEQMTNRKFRVQRNERPIVSYVRASKQTEEEVLRLLAEASRRASAEGRALAKRGAVARAAEYRLRAGALHQAMREVWEGVGYLTIFGERNVADAAVSSAQMLQSRYYKALPLDVRLMLERQARSGIDSFLSRKENTLPLSRRIYKNYDLSIGRIDREINLAMLQGKSVDEIAKIVERYVNPKAMGGVKYNAYRLARTEMANAFHLTTIRHSREQPWVRGYKWNKSSSHKRADVCDEYADNDHDNLGPGVFKKSNVPGKPHPLCLCYLTTVVMPLEQFVSSYNAGRFQRYFDLVSEAA